MEVPYLYISLFLLASYLFTTHFSPKISAKYGPVLLLRFGFRHVLLISCPSAAEECFTTNDIVFANRPRLLFGKIIGNNYTSFGWASYGEHWRNLRRIASLEILSTRHINEFYDTRVDEGRLLIRKLMSPLQQEVFCRRYKFIFTTETSYIIYKLIRYSSTVNLRSVFYELTLNMMMRMISGKRYFGGDIPALEEEGERFREMMDETFLLSGAANVGDYLPVGEKLDGFFQRLIEQLRTSKGEMKNTKKTMIEVLLSLQESDPEYYTDQMIRSFVQVLIFAGTDTSSGTMEWSLSLLLNHP
ncbi:putative isoflavone 3'-hydroxylase [Helianthus anomalus]